MSHELETSKNKSLLEIHLGLITESILEEPAVSLEKTRVASFKKDQFLNSSFLMKPRSHRKKFFQSAAFFALAASVFLAIYPWNQEGSGFSIKGGEKVFYVTEVDGQRAVLNSEQFLNAGDKIGVEVQVAEDSLAFFAVLDAGGNLLSGVEALRASALKIPAGSKGSFPFAFELDRVNDHETVVVLVCKTNLSQRDLATKSEEELSLLVDQYLKSKDDGVIQGVCTAYRKTVR